jgi:hypothetical protein
MTEQELNILVESKLAAALATRLQADRAQIREDVIRGIRREAERAWYDRVNARHPIQGPGDPKVEAARRAAMRAAAAKANAEMDAANARPIEGSLVHQRKRASIGAGSEGFEIRSGRRS